MFCTPGHFTLTLENGGKMDGRKMMLVSMSMAGTGRQQLVNLFMADIKGSEFPNLEVKD